MTIKEFAEQLDLSTATISRAFTQGSRIHPDTRALVLEQARTLGYAPNPSARNLARRHNRLIGLDCPGNPDMLADPYLIELARGVQTALGENNYGLLLNTLPRPGGDLELLHEWVYGHAVDGVVIVVPANYPLQTFCPFVARDIPCVLITQARAASDRVLPAVEIDIASGARAALMHLVRLGHTEIGLIISAPGDGVRAIYQDVCAEMLDEGRCPDPGLVVETPSAIANGRTAMHRLLAAPVRPTAVFCRTDLLALGALRAARDMGLRVPEDLSIIGHDDLVLVELSDPPLTTVRIDTALIGLEASSLLLSLMNCADSDASKRVAGEAADLQPESIRTVTVKSELIVRDSTARPPVGTRR